jgi:hypothetical protein
MKHEYLRILGISLIIFSWLIWAMIIILPFFKLTVTQYAIAYPILLVATNIFWVGAALVGKELIQKYNILTKIKEWFTRLRQRRKSKI